MKIKIKKVPTEGHAPEEVRNEWLDVVIPGAESIPAPEGTLAETIEACGLGNYRVKCSDAIDSLIKAGKIVAAEYWKSFHNCHLIFKKKDCDVVAD